MKSTNNSGGLGIKNVFLTLLIAICLAGLYYGFVHLRLMIAKNPQQVRLYYKKVYRFSEQEKSAFIKTHAGLWQFNVESMAGGKTVKKTDRLEIKENGIVWQVTEWNITMPSGSQQTFCQIRTAFIKPYGVMKNDSMCDAFILTQAFITAADTCFGGWNYPELWEFHKDGASLVFNKRRYTFYNGGMPDFFPVGSIAYVRSAENQFFNDTVMGTSLNQIFNVRKVDPQTGKIRLVPIRDSLNNLCQLFKTAINRECMDLSGKAVNQDTITALIDRYFEPLIINEKLRNFPRELPAQVTASFIVKPDGGVDSIALTSATEIDKMLSEDLSREIGSWRFPSSREPIKTLYAFKMP